MKKILFEKTIKELQGRKLIEETRNERVKLTDKFIESFINNAIDFFRLAPDEIRARHSVEECIDSILIMTIVKSGRTGKRKLYQLFIVLKPLLIASCPKLENMSFEELEKEVPFN